MFEEEGTHSKDRDEDTLSNTKINELILKIFTSKLGSKPGSSWHLAGRGTVIQASS